MADRLNRRGARPDINLPPARPIVRLNALQSRHYQLLRREYLKNGAVVATASLVLIDAAKCAADLEEAEVKGVINNFFSKNGTLGAAFTVSGKPYPKAVMALPDSNATSTVAYRLPAGVVRARGRVGIFTPKYAKPTDQPAAPIAFQLVADGEIVWSSPPLNKRDDTATFDVAIRNAAKLELLTTCTGHNNNAWAAWLDPVIVK